ncbi:glycosyltransferase family 4 protein [Actinomadura luteofluorescens]|uniref:glycosyltransferase family 4 protein n=1 Tax=Actinomadura luteofluorescens TaxID=46163 RepID=UPI00362EA8C9
MSENLRLAVVNWRDPWHPSAGGAERYAWELARRFAGEGTRVHYVTSRAPGQKRRERVEDVEFVRLGGRFTVYPLVLLWMLGFRLRRRRFDAIVDCQNGIPFFTPWVMPRRVPVFCVIHHVHDAQFGLYFPGWLAWVGQVLEGPVSRWTYRRHAFVVVSPSTQRAVRERLGWTGPTHVVPNGTVVAEPEGAVTEPAGGPDLVCVTRLVPHKRLPLLLDLAGDLAETHPGVKLHIIGDGPEAGALAAEIRSRGLEKVVIAHGYVPENVKSALVARADLHLSTSQGRAGASASSRPPRSASRPSRTTWTACATPSATGPPDGSSARATTRPTSSGAPSRTWANARSVIASPRNVRGGRQSSTGRAPPR